MVTQCCLYEQGFIHTVPLLLKLKCTYSNEFNKSNQINSKFSLNETLGNLMLALTELAELFQVQMFCDTMLLGKVFIDVLY